MNITSSSFKDGNEIPKKHGYKFDNLSPELIISDTPKEAKSLALIMDDPDAKAAVGKLWVHWIVWNIPPYVNVIKENTLPNGTVQGKTDFGEVKYGGPAPPDKKHTYLFKLYALDQTLDLPSGSTKNQLEQAMKNHIIKESLLTGTFAP